MRWIEISLGVFCLGSATAAVALAALVLFVWVARVLNEQTQRALDFIYDGGFDGDGH
jgi:hypothetical protein